MAGALFFAVESAAADDLFSKASWIWTGQADAICHVRRTFDANEEVKSAKVQVTADNGYELYVNGAFVGSDIGVESAVWQSVETYEVGSLLSAGLNVVAVRATDLGGQAGFICAVSVDLAGGETLQFVSDEAWRVSSSADPTGFAQKNYREEGVWKAATVIGRNGVAPWGKMKSDGAARANGIGVARGFKDAADGFEFPSPLIFIRGRAAESSTAGSPQAVWRIGNSRACLEIDTLGPSMAGHRLQLLTRAGVGGTNFYREQTLFVEAGGLVGSATVSHDGRTVLFSRVGPGEKFWRVCALNLRNRTLRILTSGPFHDFDPEPLPDGRIVFSSTRIGNREEYHGNMARSLFVMNGDGSGIEAITHHIVADLEPRLTADGNIVFVRQDNFMERAKVETHIHSVRPDGTAGQVLLGPDRGALGYNPANAAEENGLWLRNFGFGSPAPLPDGRVAALSSAGLVISGSAIRPKVTLRPAVELVDIAPLPDGRLLCSLGGHVGFGVVDLEKNEITRIYATPPFDAHSVVFAGQRVAPNLPRAAVEDAKEKSQPTGFLLGQSVYLTRQRNVDISRVKAIRVIEGRPFATRSARHPYDHLGVEAIELGTVPLAPDGSFYIEAPADRALSIQAVDGEGRSVVNELSWIYVRPGEQRSCVGCHSQQDAAPRNVGQIMALRRAPVKLLGAGDPHQWRGNNAANGGVLNMQFERMREVGSINAHERRAEEWIERLGGREIVSRISASQRLAALREKSAAAELEKMLEDDSAEVRLNAALALATCGRRESVQLLFNSLLDVDSAVAQAGAVALKNLTGGAVAFNGFAPLEERRKHAAEWESVLDIESLESRLIARLSCDPVKAEDTLNALGHVGTGVAVKAIEAFVASGTNDLRSIIAAVRALGQIGSVEAVAGLAKLLREQSAIETRGPGDHEFGWTQGPVQIAAAAAEALGRIGSAKSEQVLLSAFATLRDFWEFSFRTADHDWLMGCHASPVHYRILEALDRVGSERAAGIVPQILRSMPIDPDRAVLFENDAYETVAASVIARSGLRENVVRSCAAILLGQSVAADFIPAVTNSPPAVSVGPMAPVARVAQILSIICNPGDAPLLREALAKFRANDVSSERNWTCFYLARGLGKTRDQSATELLASILQDDPAESSLGLLQPPNVFVFEAMTPMYRAAAADALGRIGSSASFNRLLHAASSDLNALDVRNASAAALIRIATTETSAQIRSVAAACPEISTRKLLFEACEAGEQSKSFTAQ